jgi:hypothetical protein
MPCDHSFACRFPTALLFLSLVALFVLGCDDRPKRYKVSGQVTVDGAPLGRGVIQIVPESGRASNGLIENGSYTMRCYEEDDGVIPGTHRVTINGAEHLSNTKIKWNAPKKYSQLNDSQLTATIDADTEELNFDLSWEGKKPYVENTGRSSVEETSDDI